jgi:hypothetical protein
MYRYVRFTYLTAVVDPVARMNMTSEVITPQVSGRLRDRLAELGSKDDTFEDMLWRLIKGTGTIGARTA